MHSRAILIREKAMLVSFDVIRMVILQDALYLLSVPAGNGSKQLSRLPDPDSPFVKELVAKLCSTDLQAMPDRYTVHFTLSVTYTASCGPQHRRPSLKAEVCSTLVAGLCSAAQCREHCLRLCACSHEHTVQPGSCHVQPSTHHAAITAPQWALGCPCCPKSP